VFVKCSFKAVNSVKSCYGARRGAIKVEMWSKVLWESSSSLNSLFQGLQWDRQSCNVVFTVESVDEILKCDHSNESYWAVLPSGAVYCAVQGDLRFESVDEILNCNYLNESYWPVLEFGAVFWAEQSDWNVWDYGWSPKIYPVPKLLNLMLSYRQSILIQGHLLLLQTERQSHVVVGFLLLGCQLIYLT